MTDLYKRLKYSVINEFNMKRILTIIIGCFLFLGVSGENFSIQSPDSEIVVKIAITKVITYEISFQGKAILAPSEIFMQLDNHESFGISPKLKKSKQKSVNEKLYPIVPRKNKEVTDHYNEIKFDFKNDYSLYFRVYNEGVAYRWASNIKDSITIISEQAMFNFYGDHQIWFPEEESMMSHQERLYKYIYLSEITPDKFCSTATLVDLGDGKKVFISEADLLNYPGMFLKGMKQYPYALQSKFAKYPLEVKAENDRNFPVTKTEPYIARTSGMRAFPWRVLVITENDKELVESDLIWKLSTPNQIDDPSWIKPGKVAWDWWNDNNIYGVDFKSGINTETYKYYIDLAHDYGLEYIILDEGWYHLGDVLNVVDEIDIPELVAYGKERNVEIILWVVWKTFYDKLDDALNKFQEWGIKGIKVDFMQRDDQWMVNYYTEVAHKAAEHQLLVDFHGAYKPTGLHRTYPNVLTFEGLKGLENCKWGESITPEHDLTLPFIRMVAGPMDYTPGAMLNASKESFRAVWSQPMSQGTRCHQLAMYVVYESPLQMVSDNPSNLRKETECMEFLSQVPSTWDETIVLEAKVSDYIIVARKNGDEWYIGAMTDWDSREFEIDLDFLDPGNYTLEIWKDGSNADKYASDYKKEKTTVNADSKIRIKMAKGGGWVAIIKQNTGL